VALGTTKKNLWMPVINWLDPEVGLRVNYTRDGMGLSNLKLGINLPSDQIWML
jgi:hypothetical protein